MRPTDSNSGRAPPSESLTNSNSVAKLPGRWLSLNRSLIHSVARAPSLNRMAASNINSDAAIQANFSGSGSFANTNMAARGLIQLNHIAHWSFFLTTSVHSLKNIDFPFPEATTKQLMYGTYTMPSQYFESN
ncbi:hypothetical protein PCANC_00609 [Puccinia coronata f. sp. avenae]|uniref:Uncharacterized protein n=1 Tax=Puccinia coronata f. sp. avenae TaxID=200324 RepID=A0A2N5VEP4_9BASI|nr:hypothetical protein PCASD_02862 [Puccinia coronata f. sp. avenae]PLW58434.1 hypothetical protein PCANC_00609 [Puccinia coronata f. sp. avenae]